MNATERQVIYNSRESAYLSLLTSEVKTGHLYLKRYENEEGKLDILMAYGVQDCTTGYPDSIDSLKIISGSSPFPVYNIVFHNPDVSELARGQVYLYVDMRDESTMDCDVKLLTIEKDDGQIYRKNFVDFGETKRHVYSLSQGEFYYVSNHSFRPAENYYTREEINGTLSNILDGEVRPTLTELLRAVFPLGLNFRVNPTIAEKNTTVDVSLSYSVSRKEQDVTELCSVSLTQSPTGGLIEIPEDKIIKNVSESRNILELLAEYEPGYDVSKKIEIPFVYRSYWGVIPSSYINIIINPALNPMLRPILDSLKNTGNSGLRTKGTFTYSNISLNLSQTVVYAYPASYGNLSSIKDANGFEYITDYNKYTVNLDEVDYYLYAKITPTVITGFKQIYSF